MASKIASVSKHREGSRELRIEQWLQSLHKDLHFDPTKDQNKHFIGRSLINYCPSNKHVLIAPINIEMETEAGLLIPKKIDQETLVDKRTESSNYIGMIISAAPDAIWYRFEGKEYPYIPGDLCTYTRHRETFIEFGTKQLLMVTEFDVFAIIPDNLYYNFGFDARGDAFQSMRHMVVKADKVNAARDKPKNIS